jgi:hypothetical protein
MYLPVYGISKKLKISTISGRKIVKNPEHRRVPRHRGKLPISLKSGEGITRDFNVSGIYFETDRSFSAGQTIEFTIELKHADPAHPVRMTCKGEIVRVEQSGDKIGVAASIEKISFEELKNHKEMVRG